MNQMCQKTTKLRLLPAVQILLVLCLTFSAIAAQPPKADCVMLLQKTPAAGGTVTPSVDAAHYYDYDTTVKLVAVPNAGYHFVYWLGDVTDSTANNTTTTLDTPKYIIAVFAKDEFGLQEPGGTADISGPPSMYTRPAERRSTSTSPDDEPEYPDPEIFYFVLEEEPIPEISTRYLFGTGMFLLLRKQFAKRF